ncbi:MAG: sodium:calcium antiporter [Gemmatimonadota bacterium]
MAVVVFVSAAAVIFIAGTLLTRTADELADATGLGEALFGAVLLGGSTSLPGIVTSVTAAHQGFGELAVTNALGGIAAQTVFLSIADLSYRKANLEHASASIENMMSGALLASLLALVLIALAGPEISLLGVHPASLLILVGYGFGLHLIHEARETPHWVPRLTTSTVEDVVAEQEEGKAPVGQGRLWIRFALLAVVVGVSGWFVANSGIAIVNQTGLSESVVGALLTAVATSLPELVTSVAAVRRGAVTLAVGGILGGNAFDVLFVSFADVAYRPGSIYHAVSLDGVFLVALTLLLTSILLLGLLRRERTGVLGIGFESALVLVFYLGGMALLIL